MMKSEDLAYLLLRLLLHFCMAGWTGVFTCLLVSAGQKVELEPFLAGFIIYAAAILIHRRCSGRGKGT